MRRLDLDLSDDVIRALSNAKTRVVEKVLMLLRNQLDKAIDRTNALKARTKALQDSLTKGNADEILDIRESLIKKGVLPSKVLEREGFLSHFYTVHL